MEYIIFKSKIFGNYTINLTEAINGKSRLLKEDVDNIQEIKKQIESEYKKQSIKMKDQIENIVKSSINSKETEDKIVEIVSNCLVQLYKQLWNKRSVWKSGIKNSAN